MRQIDSTIQVTNTSVNGTFCDSPIQYAIDQAAPGSQIQIEEGQYPIRRPLKWSNKQLLIHGNGLVELIQEFDSSDAFGKSALPLLSATNANGSKIQNLIVVGSDSATTYKRLLQTLNSQFPNAAAINVSNSIGITISNITIRSKILGMCLQSCSDATISHIDLIGFGSEVLEKGFPANWHSGVAIVQGSRISITNIRSENMGNTVVTGRFRPSTRTVEIPHDILLSQIRIRRAADNGIYVSSGDRIQISKVRISECHSSGIKIQGNHVSVLASDISRASNGVTILSAEREPIFERRFAGRGTLVKQTTFSDCRSRGIHFGHRPGPTTSQLGDYLTYQNAILDCRFDNSAGIAAISGAAEHTTLKRITIDRSRGAALLIRAMGKFKTLSGWNVRDLKISRSLSSAIQVRDLENSNWRNIDIDLQGLRGMPGHVGNTKTSVFAGIKSNRGNLVFDRNCSGNAVFKKNVISQRCD